MQENLQQKKGFVKGIFNRVVDKYDLMNDFMSFGIHRAWKRELIYMMNPSKNQKLLDVACGTGDIAKLYIKLTGNKSNIVCVDPNYRMISLGKKKLKKYKNIKWKISSAEKLNFPDNTFDFYTIVFGLRNTKSIDKTISEAYRILKKGGRFFCLEFSKIENSNLKFIYKNYSKLIPIIGQIVVGDRKPYDYLIESIDKFINQNELIEVMEKGKFENCNYKNLSGGIVSIHSGWKV